MAKKDQNRAKDRAAEGTQNEFTPTPERIRNLRKQVTQTATPTEAEQQARRREENIIESRASGIADVKDQPIAMPFIRGQAAGIRRQAQAKLEPLQTRLSRLQREREQRRQAATQQLQFAQSDFEREQQFEQQQQEREREEQESLAKRQRERRESIRQIADEARERGASQEVVSAIMASETPEQATQASAAVAPVGQESQFETRSIAGGGILQLETDPQTGEVIDTKVVRQPEQGDTQSTAEEPAPTETTARTTPIDFTTINQAGLNMQDLEQAGVTQEDIQNFNRNLEAGFTMNDILEQSNLSTQAANMLRSITGDITVEDVADQLGVTTRDLNKGLNTSGKTLREFSTLSPNEQRRFIFGEPDTGGSSQSRRDPT